MMLWRNVAWWLLYSFSAAAMQAVFPGLDFFLPGFLLALQEQRPIQSLCVGIWFILLQEGMGSLAFGGTALMYALTVIFFYSGCQFFQGRNFLFVVLLGAILAAIRYVLFPLLCRLQDFPVRMDMLFNECLLQVFLTPFAWWGARSLRGSVKHEAGE